MINFSIRNKALSFILLISLFALVRCSGSVESQLKERAEAENKQYPRVDGQWTRIDSCAAIGLAYRYYITITEIIVSDTSLFKANLKPQMIKTVKSDSELMFFKENGVTLEYKCNDNEGRYICTITIKPEEYN